MTDNQIDALQAFFGVDFGGRSRIVRVMEWVRG
jgi:hypothetical protein